MITNELTEVCRLCPSISTPADSLLDVFESGKNMKEVILVTTGIEILESDLVSKKICERCCRIAYHMYKFRQDALKQDRILKEKCNIALLGNKDFSLTTLKQENDQHVRDIHESRSEAIAHIESLHPSVENIYKANPLLKIPKKCMKMDWNPIVELTIGDVERYNDNIDSRISQSHTKVSKSTACGQSKTVAPLKISKRLFGNYAVQKKTATRKRSLSTSHCPLKKKKVETQASKIPHRRASVHPSVIPVPVEVPNLDEEVNEIPSEAPITDQLTSSSTSQLDSMESFGLTQTVTTLKSQPLLTCNICGSLHNNSFELKRHTLKHMTCQFCKRKLRNWELKQFHIDNECQVRKMINSPGLVPLEKIDLNLAIRNQYNEAFLGFEPLHGQEKSNPVGIQTDVINLISDDEELPPVPVTTIVPSSSLVKPDVRIKRIDIPALNELPSTTSVQDLIKTVQKVVPVEKTFSTSTTSTELPNSSDIVVADTYCILPRLRDQLAAYKMCINVSFGDLNTTYGKRTQEPKAKMDCWTNCPVVCKRTRRPLSVDSNKPAAMPVVGNEVIVIDDEPEEPPSLRFFNNGRTLPAPLLQKFLTAVPPITNKTIILNNYMFQNGQILPKNQAPMRQNASLGNEFQRKTTVSTTHNRHITTPLDMTHRRLLPNANELERPDTDGPALRVKTVAELT